MDWLFQLVILWFAVSLFVVATGWYASSLVPRLWPGWWREVVVDIEPETRFGPKRG